MNYDNKKFVTLLKAIFYQLFSRKMQFVVFNGDPSKSQTLMFSNVPLETMLVYDDSPEYCFHEVMIRDLDFVADFYKRFPILKNHPCFIRVVDFLSTFTKNKDIDKSVMAIDDEDITLSYDTVDSTTKEETTTVNSIGSIITPVEADMYTNVYRSGKIVSDDPYSIKINKSEVGDDESKVMLVNDIAHPTDKFPSQCALVILQPGFNVPTLNSFCKAVKESEEFELLAGYDKNCIILNCVYDTTLLKSYGTHPAQRWFVKNKRI